jgi:hypothetical protein
VPSARPLSQPPIVSCTGSVQCVGCVLLMVMLLMYPGMCFTDLARGRQGRTGTIICCYLMLSGMFLRNEDGSMVADPNVAANAALRFFLDMRGEGVNYTSQERTVKYFAKARGDISGAP